jgi:hypothetical protein
VQALSPLRGAWDYLVGSGVTRRYGFTSR